MYPHTHTQMHEHTMHTKCSQKQAVQLVNMLTGFPSSWPHAQMGIQLTQQCWGVEQQRQSLSSWTTGVYCQITRRGWNREPALR